MFISDPTVHYVLLIWLPLNIGSAVVFHYCGTQEARVATNSMEQSSEKTMSEEMRKCLKCGKIKK